VSFHGRTQVDEVSALALVLLLAYLSSLHISTTNTRNRTAFRDPSARVDRFGLSIHAPDHIRSQSLSTVLRCRSSITTSRILRYRTKAGLPSEEAAGPSVFVADRIHCRRRRRRSDKLLLHLDGGLSGSLYSNYMIECLSKVAPVKLEINIIDARAVNNNLLVYTITHDTMTLSQG